ncbi:thiamine-phosphate pyrophosphorylase [Hydrogenoanaerobacterium saccharovorans]|uniref:Thiamine-phosphate synthase n=1 Tax=Hydrogenoanaerobacterium saccharovorans TaxID=474960 RepID=A0A1H8E8J5_9FIRM|nr:thiamine phosphate synthase [Hydrogenoanaerobacterium saccharovorans]RPF41942.1 thiamine-phosphate pyrophosphorylase [Hydrogenoanaerobacterium saccharovorans]SEN15772.1 thiamine-phosphate pyrophosphorylase [Hydrogenoanaerobacterium saccharovorans]
MRVDKSSMLLYAVTDRTWLGRSTLSSQVEESIKAGVTFVQLREKQLDFDAFVAQAKEIKSVTDRYRIPFVINDNIEVALACNADGVHVGQGDLSASAARKKLGEQKILGVSVQTVQQAIAAEQSGADYLGVGAVFSTSTKMDADAVSFETLKKICSAVSIPVVAIGGINKDNILQLSGSGIDGIAVVSAIFAQPDITVATAELHQLAQKMVNI